MDDHQVFACTVYCTSVSDKNLSHAQLTVYRKTC